jgi:hypothetical protein
VAVAQGYKVFYTMNPGMPIASWDSQVVDHNPLTTISDLTPHTIYTIRVQAETSVGGGPLSTPVQVKTQHGVPSQPTGLRAIDVSATSVSLEWARPHHTGENVNSYELYWNDTFTKVRAVYRPVARFFFHFHFDLIFYFYFSRPSFDNHFRPLGRLGETSSASARQ